MSVKGQPTGSSELTKQKLVKELQLMSLQHDNVYALTCRTFCRVTFILLSVSSTVPVISLSFFNSITTWTPWRLAKITAKDLWTSGTLLRVLLNTSCPSFEMLLWKSLLDELGASELSAIPDFKKAQGATLACGAVSYTRHYSKQCRILFTPKPEELQLCHFAIVLAKSRHNLALRGFWILLAIWVA